MSSNTRCDFVIRGGRVFLDKPPYWIEADVAVKDGRIEAIIEAKSRNANATRGLEALYVADTEYSATGQMLLPGLVDFHTHVYWGGTPLGINPDKLAPLTGGTRCVEMGSAGAGNFEGL